MALVELLLSPLPAHVSTARLVVVAAARRAGLPEDALDEVRLAIGEAASRAVGLHAKHAPEQPVRVSITDDPRELALTVTDRGPAAGPVPDDPAAELLAGDDEQDYDPDLALAVLTGLLDDVSVEPGVAGTVVTMRWALAPGSGPGGTVLSQ